MSTAFRFASTPPPHRAGRRLSLGFLTPHNPFDRTSFSGTAFHMARALAGHPDLDLRLIGGHQPPGFWTRFPGMRKPGALTQADVDPAGLDVLVGLVATDLLNALPADFPVPVLHVTDATVPFLRETYGWQIPVTADDAEARVIARAAATVYSSRHMAERARGEQGTDLALSVPFGINFEDTPATCPEKPPLSRLNLLFVGLDWTRKGGDVAVATLDRLRAAGHAAELTVVGRVPARLRRHPGVRVAGLLDKNRPADRRRLSRLFATSHLLLLPTRGDCTPMVLAEAMAHGTPVLASAIGGIPELVGTGGAGRLLGADADAALWAATVLEMTGDPTAYALLSDAAFDRAATQFSWANWAARIARIARQSAKGRHANAA